ncbi:MAG TPA: OmpA family protein [Geminicoccaceae bacterium]|nr:OmpA family protein [Geminicoccus sp.]HMU50379.1 OmpA family protein [Geminicoccaceae bacterium]
MRKIAVLAASLLALAACSSNDETLSGTTGAGTGTATDTASGTAGMGTGVSSSELGGAPEPGSARDFEVNVGDRIFFAYDSSVVDDAGRETLQRQATWLQQFPDVPVYIEGHTDATGTREYNLALGERRANAAKNYLEALGVPAHRLTAVSYGEERPADPGESADAAALNRRAVTVVHVTN